MNCVNPNGFDFTDDKNFRGQSHAPDTFKKGGTPMFKIEIKDEAGRELKTAKDNYIYYKGTDGKDTFWEWEHIKQRGKAFDPLFTQARTLIDAAEKNLPDWPMSGLR